MASLRLLAVLCFWTTACRAVRQEFPLRHLQLLLTTPHGLSRHPFEAPQFRAVGPGVEEGGDVHDGFGAPKSNSQLAEGQTSKDIVPAAAPAKAQSSGLAVNMSPRAEQALKEVFTGSGIRKVELDGLNDNKVEAIVGTLSGARLESKKLSFLGNTNLTSSGWAYLLSPIARAGSSLETVEFNWCFLADDAAQAIAEQMMNMGATVKALQFSSNEKLTSVGWTDLLRPLSSPGARIQRVGFSSCDLDDSCAEAISINLANMGRIVKDLDFDGNARLTAAGWEVLLEPLTDFDGASYLESVNFAWCDLDDSRAAAISKQLKAVRPTIKRLDFANSSKLAASSWTTLLQPLTRDECSLVAVGFGGCDLHDSHARTIAHSLRSISPIMRKLDLGGSNRLSDSGWSTLLRPMTTEGGGFEEVDFHGCDLDDASAAAIGEQLAAMAATVSRLDFSDSPALSPSVWTALLGPLARAGSSLEQVDFGRCGLDDAKATVLGQQLSRAVPTLRRVNFHGNKKLTLDGWKVLLPSLTILGSNVEAVNFEGCDLDDESAVAVASSLLRLDPTTKIVDFALVRLSSPEQWTELLRPLTTSEPVGSAVAAPAQALLNGGEALE